MLLYVFNSYYLYLCDYYAYFSIFLTLLYVYLHDYTSYSLIAIFLFPSFITLYNSYILHLNYYSCLRYIYTLFFSLPFSSSKTPIYPYVYYIFFWMNTFRLSFSYTSFSKFYMGSLLFYKNYMYSFNFFYYSLILWAVSVAVFCT